MSTLKVDAIKDTSGKDQYTTKVWMNFNGATATILGSGNISSVTDNGVGNYTLNYSNALADANYSAVQAATAPVATHHVHGYIGDGIQAGDYSTTALKVYYFRDENSATGADPVKLSWQVAR